MRRHKFITVRLSEGERDQLLKMAREWGVQRSEVLRFCFRSILLGLAGRSPDLRGAAPDLREVDHP
jgi:hypothetical protein